MLLATTREVVTYIEKNRSENRRVAIGEVKKDNTIRLEERPEICNFNAVEEKFKGEKELIARRG